MQDCSTVGQNQRCVILYISSDQNASTKGYNALGLSIKRGDRLVFRGVDIMCGGRGIGPGTSLGPLPPPSLPCLPSSPPCSFALSPLLLLFFPPFGVLILHWYLLKLALLSAAPLSSPPTTPSRRLSLPKQRAAVKAQLRTPPSICYSRTTLTSAIEGHFPSLSPLLPFCN